MPYEVSDEQRKGSLIGGLLAGAVRGFTGGGLAGGVQGALQGYTGGINALYDRQSQELEQRRMEELMAAEQVKNNLAIRKQNWDESPDNPDNSKVINIPSQGVAIGPDGKILFDNRGSGGMSVGDMLKARESSAKFGDPTDPNYNDYRSALSTLYAGNMQPSDVSQVSALLSPVIGSDAVQDWRKPIDEQFKEQAQATSDRKPTFRDKTTKRIVFVDKAGNRYNEDMTPYKGVTSNLQTLSDEAGQNKASIFVNNRITPALDSENGNAPTFTTPGQVKKEPNRYMPASSGMKALDKTNLTEDIRGSIQNTRANLANMPDFDEKTRGKLYFAIRSSDPSGALDNLLNGEIGKTLTPEQQQYIVDLSVLHENAMAMRSVLGAGQGSDDLRRAIRETIPGKGTFSKGMAQMQLNRFEQTLNRLERGFPKVKLRTDTGAQPSSAASGVVWERGTDGKFHPKR